jgi:hypothetical protein
VSDEPPDSPGALPPDSDEPQRPDSGWLMVLGALVGVLAVLGVVTLVVGGICAVLLNGFGG